ncbi:cell division protein ZapE [Jonesia quinghaiensis]|uniref:cell division protein ZapE n=1 Tax=Jonesia quinghaiensis TaxID=262806 RepID=UPI0004025787|nr:cell division protein ZapE [Jonesia quinghaiensis]
MTSPLTDAAVNSLTARTPRTDATRLLGDLTPPQHFHTAHFDTYRPDPDHPSQESARQQLIDIAKKLTSRRTLRQRLAKTPPPAVYLDGGFGVGKTHLLASLAHEIGPDAASFGTFVEYTNLVGALGFQETVTALSSRRLVCIDEFELDDPGDTVLMSRLLRELADNDVALAATSNTLPESLGEGRFAAEDFLREIQALAARFTVLRIDGEDYRRRETVTHLDEVSDEAIAARAAHLAMRQTVTLDSFDAVLQHLTTVHPSAYGALLDGISVVALTNVRPMLHQASALRFVVLVDRLYDHDVPVLLGGSGLDGLFTEEMLRGGYRKKYYRALSRLGALAQQGLTLSE